MASIKYIFNMHNLSKYGLGKEILKDINLSFLPGAKIGVLGVNGSGKSTLLKIMAGEETTFSVSQSCRRYKNRLPSSGTSFR